MKRHKIRNLAPLLLWYYGFILLTVLLGALGYVLMKYQRRRDMGLLRAFKEE